MSDTTTPRIVRRESDRLEALAAGLGNLLKRKVRQYGAAHHLQPELLKTLLKAHRQADGTYALPSQVLVELPRVVRALDRLCRITSGSADTEDPWIDLAGDALAGHSVSSAYRADMVTLTRPQTRAEAEQVLDEALRPTGPNGTQPSGQQEPFGFQADEEEVAH